MLDSENKTVAGVYRRPRTSTTIDRRQVTRPVQQRMLATKKEVVIPRPSRAAADGPMTAASSQQVRVNVSSRQVAPQPARQQVVQQAAPQQMHQMQQPMKRPTASEIKETAIKKAILNASKKEVPKKKSVHVRFGLKRVLLAMSCAAAAVFAIVYFVNLNAPNVSLKVAAMQTGIEATYPSYIPRDYSLSDITSESGKITLNFKNPSTDAAFSIVEETSSWDSNALLNNFVRGTYGDNYTTIREQGLTLYISGSNATWVNGGIVYKLTTTSGSLTKKQIKAIAVSL